MINKRIAFVHANNIDIGGSDLSMRRIVFAAKSSGYIPIVFLSKYNKVAENYTKAGIKTIYLPMPRVLKSKNPYHYLKWTFSLFIATLKLAHLFRNEGIKLVYANDINELPATLAAWLLRIPRMMSIRFFFHAPTLIRQSYMILLAWVANKIICNSDAVKNYNFKGIPSWTKKVVTIYNWYEKPLQKGCNIDLENPFKSYGIPSGSNVVLMPGRFENWKGQHVLVKASPIIIDAIDNVYILFVGDRVQGRGRETYVDYLKDLARNLRTSDRIIFGEHTEDIDTLIKAADVIAHCSITPEPFGMTVLEALYHGTPTVASCAGGILEIVGTPSCALLHTPGNKDELAERIIQILTNFEFALELRKQGKIRASKFSKEESWPKFESLIKELLSGYRKDRYAFRKTIS